jgi:hypothetical protein
MNKTPSVLTCRRNAAVASECCSPWLANQLATELVRRSEYTPAMIVRTPARMPNQLLFPVIARINPFHPLIRFSADQNLLGKYPAKEHAQNSDDDASYPELNLRARLNS